MLRYFAGFGVVYFSITLVAYAEGPFRFSDVVQSAIKNSLDQKVYRNNVQTANIEKDLADTQNRVQITASSSLGAKVTAGEPKSDEVIIPPSQSVYDQNYGLQLNKVLFDFGRKSAAVEKQEYEFQQIEKTAKQNELALYYKIARSYEQLLNAMQVQEIVQKQLEQAEARAKQMQNNYRTGLRSESDLTKSQFDLGKVQLAMSKAKDDVVEAKVQIAVLMRGRSVLEAEANQISIEEKSLRRTAAEWQDLHKKILQKSPLNTREEIWQAQKKSVLASVNLLDAQQRPKISGILFAQAPGTMTPLKSTVGAQLQLSWEIPWDNMYALEKDQLNVQGNTIDLKKNIQDLQMQSQAESGQRNLEIALRQFESSDAQVTLSAKLRDLVKARYEAGKASVFELSNADDDVLATRLEKKRVQHALVLALIDIAEAKQVGDIHEIFE